MKKEEIIHGNVIIADFIPLKKDGNNWLFDNQWYGINDLLFHKSWDWIFYALDKVQELDVVYHWELTENGFAIYSDETFENLGSGIEKVWLGIVEFIIWYKENNVGDIEGETF